MGNETDLKIMFIVKKTVTDSSKNPSLHFNLRTSTVVLRNEMQDMTWNRVARRRSVLV